MRTYKERPKSKNKFRRNNFNTKQNSFHNDLIPKEIVKEGKEIKNMISNNILK